jgi:carboxyl-terminal processing protease
MRIFGAGCLAMLAAVTAICAAPVNPPASAGSRISPDHALRSDAEQYANNIKGIVLQIGEKYVRPVSRIDLFEAAVAGLYEAAHEPVPPGLRADIQRAVEEDVTPFLTRTRENLGNVEALRGHKALQVSLQALPRALDPYCGLTSRREFQRLDLTDGTPNTGLEFVGVPLVPVGPALVPNRRIVPSDGIPQEAQQPAPAGPLQVQNVQPGSPAQRAGVRPGDLIIRINGHPTDSPVFQKLFQRLRPLLPGMPFDPSESPLRLAILRPDRPEPTEVVVGPAIYRAESVFGSRRKPDGSWDYLLDHVARIGYVRIGGIGGQCHEQFRDALLSLQAAGVRGLVLDLRWCPGGFLTEATSIAHYLLPPDKVPVARQRDRIGTETALAPGELDARFTDFPVIVIVNGETSGGGELIAGALQDYGRAAVAGQRTVGKASIQNVPDQLGVPFKLTVGTFVRPSGKNLQRFPDSKSSDDWGIRPDQGRELPLTAEAGRRLKEWWVLSTLRPAGSTEALPLDDPENDPQRYAAVQMLRGTMRK